MVKFQKKVKPIPPEIIYYLFENRIVWSIGKFSTLEQVVFISALKEFVF